MLTSINSGNVNSYSPKGIKKRPSFGMIAPIFVCQKLSETGITQPILQERLCKNVVTSLVAQINGHRKTNPDLVSFIKNTFGDFSVAAPMAASTHRIADKPNPCIMPYRYILTGPQSEFMNYNRGKAAVEGYNDDVLAMLKNANFRLKKNDILQALLLIVDDKNKLVGVEVQPCRLFQKNVNAKISQLASSAPTDSFMITQTPPAPKKTIGWSQLLFL